MARLGLLARGAVGEVGSAAGATGGYLGVATLNEVYSGTYNPYKIMKIYLSPHQSYNRLDLPSSVSRNAASVIVVVVVVMAPAPSIEVVLLVLVRDAAAAAWVGGQEESRLVESAPIGIPVVVASPVRISEAIATRVVDVSLTRQPLLD